MFDLQQPRHIPTLPWLCKNAKTLTRDKRSYSSKTALVAQPASKSTESLALNVRTRQSQTPASQQTATELEHIVGSLTSPLLPDRKLFVRSVLTRRQDPKWGGDRDPMHAYECLLRVTYDQPNPRASVLMTVTL